jgi:pyruvate dehydrogenase E2 component (dihydrolipoamide acetyltransferase)
VGAYKKPDRLGSFRRFALAFWKPPSDGTIYGTLFVDATNFLALAKKVEAEHGVKLTPGHLIGKGLALGMRAAPSFNSKVIWGTIYQKETVDMYFQVDVEGGKDLSGVLIERADEKSIIEIAKELQEKAKSLRSGKDQRYEKTQKGFFAKLPPWIINRVLRFLCFLDFNLGLPLTFLPGVYRDPFGTCMCTNVGPFGIDIAYAPLIPVTRVGVIALVGRITDEPMVVNGKVEVRPRLTGSATFDHRLGNGAEIGKLVRTARAFYENPHTDPSPPGSPPAPMAATGAVFSTANAMQPPAVAVPPVNGG